MGLGGISIWQLLIVLAIVVMLFGTKRLRGLGGDVGNAIKGFKKAMAEDNTNKVEDKTDCLDQQFVINGEAEKVDQIKDN